MKGFCFTKENIMKCFSGFFYVSFFFNMLKIVAVAASLLLFIFHYKISNFCNKVKIYHFALLYNNILKLNSIYINFCMHFGFGIAFKFYYSALLEKLNFLHNFKKSLFSFSILHFINMFNMLKMYKSVWFYTLYNSQNRKNYELLCANAKNVNKGVHSKFSSVFIVSNYFKKNKENKKQTLNNLFSLFFYNLLIYFFVMYLFIY